MARLGVEIIDRDGAILFNRRLDWHFFGDEVYRDGNLRTYLHYIMRSLIGSPYLFAGGSWIINITVLSVAPGEIPWLITRNGEGERF